MPGTIGYDSTDGLGGVELDTTTPHRLMVLEEYRYTPPANETLDVVGFHAEGTYLAAIQVGVQRADTLALVASAVVTPNAAGRFTTTVGVPLLGGVEYLVSFRALGLVSIFGGWYATDAIAQSALTGSSPLADPFVVANTIGSGASVFAIAVSAGGDTTPPSFTAGPTVTAIGATTATISVTSNETGTVAVIATSMAASQPLNAAFDSVATAITDATPTSINLTSLTAAQLTRFWVQIKDAAGNRTTTSVLDLTGHAGYQRVVIGTPNTTAANRVTATPDIAAGDYLEWGTVVGAGTVIVNDDGTFDADAGVTAFTYYVGNLTDGWGASAVQTVGAAGGVAPTMPADSSVNVAENTTAVGTFAALSGDAPITYALSGADAAAFSINSSTGAVAYLSAPNYEAGPNTRTIIVTATNTTGSDAQTITVNVTNVVDVAPTLPADSSVSRNENSTGVIATVAAISGEAPITYSIDAPAQAWFAINTSTGAITQHTPIDYEAGPTSVAITVTATNAAGSDTMVLTVNVNDVDESAPALPIITLVGASSITVDEGDAWIDPGATVLDGEGADITARLVVSGSVDAGTAGTYELQYNATDAEGNTAATVTRTIIINIAGGAAMAEQFLHGVDLVEIDSGPRPIQTVRSSVIGIVGTAEDLDAVTRPDYFASDEEWEAAKDAFPLDTPVLVAGSLREAAKLGETGTLPAAMNGIFDQAGALVVVVRVASNATPATEQANVIGGVTGGGQYTGLRALLGAESALGVQPRIVIAPGYSHVQAVATEMITIADRLRGVAVIDGPNTTDAAAQTYAQQFGSARAYLVDPWVVVFDTVTATEVIEPPSARVAGILAASDNDRGFWWSPSNREMRGIIGTARPVDFKLGDVNSRANVLNSQKVATIINQNGYRLWGNLTLSADPKWQFLSVRRTADLIGDSLQRAHMWAVDRNITKTYLDDVTEGVNNYLRTLINLGALIGGKCWPDPDLNSASNLAAGKVYFNFDFTAPAPAQTVTFQSLMVDDYYEEII